MTDTAHEPYSDAWWEWLAHGEHGGPTPAVTTVPFDPTATHAHLTQMFGDVPGRISLSHATPGGPLRSEHFHTVLSAAAWAKQRGDHGELYVRCTTLVDELPGGGRGGEADSYALPFLWADLDFGTVGHRPPPGSLPLPPTEAAARVVLAELPEPSALIHSGGGFYPLWQLDEPILLTDAGVRAEAKVLSARWQQMIKAVAAAHGYSYGAGVGDLPRLLRLPGSVNRKAGRERPCVVLERSGIIYTRAELAAVVEAHTPATPVAPTAPPAQPAAVSASASVLFGPSLRTGPGVFDLLDEHVGWSDLLQPVGWQRVPCSDALEGWQRPGGSHPVSAKVLRENPHTLVVWSEDAGLPTGPGQKLTKGRVYAHLHHGGDMSAAATALLKGAGASMPAAFQTAVVNLVTNTATRASVDEPVDEPAPTPLPWLGDDFWASRPVLAHARAFAYARMVSPLALLGVLILRVLATVPPWVVLPPLIGGRGSLNAFVASVGPSGSGKGAVHAAAADAVDFVTPIYTATVGSGEGIAHQYAHREKGEVVQDRDSVLFFVAEVDTLTALNNRQGSTLLSQLRSSFSGETLGFAYVDPARRIPLEAHTYRLGMAVGVQPEKAGDLIDDADGGTPQRLLWLPATDPGVSADPPPEPEPIVVPQRTWTRGRGGFHTLKVPEMAARAVREAHAARNRGEGDALDGHALFVRLKVAQALALLDRRIDITEQDWELAGDLMRVSDRTRDRVVAVLRQQAVARDQARGLSDATRAITARAREAEHAVPRLARRVLQRVQEQDELSWNALKKATTSRDREHLEAAVEHLIAAGQIELVGGVRGRRFKRVV